MIDVWETFGHLMQMRDELQAAVRDLEAILQEADADTQPDQSGYENLPENAADEHAGLGFRCTIFVDPLMCSTHQAASQQRVQA